MPVSPTVGLAANAETVAGIEKKLRSVDAKLEPTRQQITNLLCGTRNRIGEDAARLESRMHNLEFVGQIRRQKFFDKPLCG